MQKRDFRVGDSLKIKNKRSNKDKTVYTLRKIKDDVFFVEDFIGRLRPYTHEELQSKFTILDES